MDAYDVWRREGIENGWLPDVERSETLRPGDRVRLANRSDADLPSPEWWTVADVHPTGFDAYRTVHGIPWGRARRDVAYSSVLAILPYGES